MGVIIKKQGRFERMKIKDKKPKSTKKFWDNYQDKQIRLKELLSQNIKTERK